MTTAAHEVADTLSRASDESSTTMVTLLADVIPPRRRNSHESHHDACGEGWHGPVAGPSGAGG